MCCVPFLNGSERKDLVSSGGGLRIQKRILSSLGENALPAKHYVVQKGATCIRGFGFLAREDGAACGNLFLTEFPLNSIMEISLEAYQLTREGTIRYTRSDWKNNPPQKLYRKPFFDEAGNFCFWTCSKPSCKDEKVFIYKYSLSDKGSGIALRVEE
jgi:hypothetical protein